MISKFKLCNVGQGLFYIGDIGYEDEKSFRFIYDCGAEKVSNIKNAIDDYIDESIIIDMLVISHFDKDHISGLELLLEKAKKIKKIFLKSLIKQKSEFSSLVISILIPRY